jgi:hypothetical protein
VGLDNIIKSIVESTLEVNELHAKISELFAKMSTLKELIDFDAVDIKDIVEGMVAKEILYFTNFSSIVKIVEHAYKIQLPYQKFWNGVTNSLLLNYHEMELNQAIQLLYYLSKMQPSLSLDPSLLSSK